MDCLCACIARSVTWVCRHSPLQLNATRLVSAYRRLTCVAAISLRPISLFLTVRSLHASRSKLGTPEIPLGFELTKGE